MNVVGMAQWRISADPADCFHLLGLGSCVAVAIYDPIEKVGAVAHVMLPDSREAEVVLQPAKFADTGVRTLRDALIARGADPARLVAKAAGGAQMFRSVGPGLALGQRNSEAVLAALEASAIPVLATDLGGSAGRSVRFQLGAFSLEIKSANRPVVML